ncbi:acyl-CoA N-acyltransferase [Melampsora americana]|nr:acyl-CoA N-acyltransferase [Melampsora americana]
MSTTEELEKDFLFDRQLIPDVVKEALGSDYIIRPLSKTDHSRSHLALLAGLTSAPDTGIADYQKRFELLRAINAATPATPTYATVCIINCSTDRMVGCGTLVLEHKFIRAGGSVGHIEDIVVDPTVRGKSLGKRIIEALTGISERLGAYKTILDCNKDNIAFYEKCGYVHKEYEMVRYTSPEIVEKYRRKL